MSRQQQLDLDATLRQGQVDLGADVPTLRAGFNELMARVPVADDVHQKPTTIGGVGAVEVTIHGTDAANVKRTSHARELIHHAGIALEEPAFAVLATQAELARWPTIGSPRLAARLIPLVSLLR